MSRKNQELKVTITAKEFDFIFLYQLAGKSLLKKLLATKKLLQVQRPNYKRVNLILTLAELDHLLSNIAREANKSNNSPFNQDLLDSLFGKLGEKYNSHAYQ